MVIGWLAKNLPAMNMTSHIALKTATYSCALSLAHWVLHIYRNHVLTFCGLPHIAMSRVLFCVCAEAAVPGTLGVPLNCDALCGPDFLALRGFPNGGCIAPDGFWRAACPAPGTVPGTNLPDNICIAPKCTFPASASPPTAGRRRMQQASASPSPSAPCAWNMLPHTEAAAQTPTACLISTWMWTLCEEDHASHKR